MERTKGLKAKVSSNAHLMLIKTPLDERKKEFDGMEFIERKMLIAIISDNTFCEWATNNFSLRYFESSTAKMMASWVYEYFNKYNQSPKTDIGDIYFEKIKNSKVPKDIAEEIEEDLLPELSTEFVKDGNSKYLQDNAERYLHEQILRRKTMEAQALIENNNLEDAAEIIKIDLITSHSLDSHFKTVDEMEAEGVKRPKLLMKPWLREGETTLLYSEAGVGKSLLAILVAYQLGLEDFSNENAEIGEWQIKHSVGTLYIDGELGSQEMVDRINKFKWIGKQKYPIKTFSIPDYQMSTGKDVDLSKRDWQKKVIQVIKKNADYKFLIIDSISTVFNLESENDNSEWNKKINPFLKDLRALGVAHIIQHHAGKDSKKGLRGASAMSAMAHNIIRLTNHPNKETGFAWFKVDNKEKQRAAGKQFDPFYIKFIPEEEDTIWEITDSRTSKDAKYTDIVKEIIKGKGNKELAEMFGYNNGTNIAYYKDKAKKDGYLDDKGKPTKKGILLLSMDEENTDD